MQKKSQRKWITEVFLVLLVIFLIVMFLEIIAI